MLSSVLLRFVVVLALLTVSFVGGFVIAERQSFPYYRILRVWETLHSFLPSSRPLPGAETTTIVHTNLLRLQSNTFPWTLDTLAIRRGGGGLAILDDTVIGVDRNGVFFRYDGGGVVRQLPFRVPTNVEDLRERKGDTDAFRFMDIAVVQNGVQNELFVSHHFWYPERQCKTTRVSRLAIAVTDTIDSLASHQPADAWETVFESQPCIEFEERDASAFQSNVNGGRLVPDGRNGLFVGIGEHHLDGVNNPLVAAQDSSISYGKIFRIDLETLEARIYANGIRNPQGLVLDRAGNLWETEHGPKGGDELNLIRDQGNYGWPLTTLGTQYLAFDWKLNALQGHHQGAAHGFEVPFYAWIPSVGISNLIQVDDRLQRWADDILVSSLTGRSLFRLRVQDGRVVFAERIDVGARIRDLVQMADGTLLLWTDDRKFIELSTIVESDSEATTDLLGTCGTCHGLAPGITNPAGPNLWAVYGREIGSTDYASYSPAFRGATGVWDEDTLRAFLLDPQSVIPGTTMPTPPTADPGTIVTLIAMLRALR